MSNQQEEPTFNVKRARLVLYISAFTFFGVIFYLGFVNVLYSQTVTWLFAADAIIASLTNLGLRKYEKEQKERKKEIERYRKW